MTFLPAPATAPGRGRRRHGRTRRPRVLGTLMIAALAGAVGRPSATLAQNADAPPAPPAQPAAGQQPGPAPPNADIEPEKALASPIVDADASIKGNRATAWNQGDDQWLLLEGDVALSVGTYGFRADRAAIQIERQTRGGLVIRKFAMFLDHARPLRGEGPVAVQANRLLVTAATTGKVNLETNLLRRESAAQDEFVVEAAARIKRYRDRVAQGAVPVPKEALSSPEAQARLAEIQRRADQVKPPAVPATPPLPSPTPPQPLEPEPKTPASAQALPPTAHIFNKKGTVSFSADKVVLQNGGETGDGESALLLIGNVRAAYQDERGVLGITLQAENGVIFLAGDHPTALAARRAPAGDIRGIYLEDNVIATSGDYTVRAPRVFYDVADNRAIVLNAVFFTWDIHRKIPIYVRADQVRQLSNRNWAATHAVVSTSDFAEPHFAIATDHVTFQQDEGTEGEPQYRFTAHDATLRAGGLPFFYWPKVSGDAQQAPLRRVSGGYEQKVGPVVRTDWDLFSLLGREKPEGVDMIGEVDWLGDHDAALGLNLTYERPNMMGHFRGYLLPDDSGADTLANRNDIGHDHDVRGFARFVHRQLLRDGWELSLEGAYVSDNTFLEEFFRRQATAAKPYETSIYVKKQQDDWAFSVLAKGDLYDFTAQTPLLQTPGYDVQKLPELGYYRVGTSLWGDRLTWYTENRFSRLSINPGEDTPASRGFGDLQSMLNFGITPTTSFAQVLKRQGIPTDSVLRLDSRHELQAPIKAGPLDIVPFITGRATLYDQDFEEYNNNQDNYRLMGTGGVRLHTQFSRTYDDFDFAMLDAHRLRHIVEPNVDVFMTGSTVPPEDLPVYDPDVEALSEGFGVRAGVRNTFQTQRGGPGQWRSVDWIVLDTDVVLRSDDAQVNQDIAHYFSYRPEFSIGGDHFHTDLLWMVSDTFATVADLTYNLEDDRLAQWRVGGALQQTERLSWFAEYGEIQDLNSRLVSYGFTYALTPKWEMSFIHVLDLEADQLNRRIEVTLMRRLPQVRLGFVASYDDIDGAATFGIVLVPEGLSRTRPIAGSFEALSR
jgi:LPS transport system D